jgi:hypothetical protein
MSSKVRFAAWQCITTKVPLPMNTSVIIYLYPKGSTYVLVRELICSVHAKRAKD